MKILYVYGTAKIKDIVITLHKLGQTVYEYPKELENSTLSQEEVDALVAYIEERDIELIMSIHLIYNLSLINI